MDECEEEQMMGFLMLNNLILTFGLRSFIYPETRSGLIHILWLIISNFLEITLMI